MKTEEQLIAMMDKWVRLGNEIHAAAKEKYGDGAQLTHEADSGVFIMARDDAGEYEHRSQDWVKEVSNENARWSAIAW